jgi:hypothetical protein
MSKVLTAEYDAEHNTLLLAEPLEGVKDHARVTVTVTPPSVAPLVSPDPERPWMAYSGILSKEAGDDLARVIEEMFPPWNADDDY